MKPPAVHFDYAAILISSDRPLHLKRQGQKLTHATHAALTCLWLRQPNTRHLNTMTMRTSQSEMFPVCHLVLLGSQKGYAWT